MDFLLKADVYNRRGKKLVERRPVAPEKAALLQL